MILEKSNNSKSMVIRSAKLILVGSLIGAITCGALLCFFAILFTFLKIINNAVISVICVAIVSSGAFVGGYCTAKISEQKGMFYGVSTAFVLFLIALLTSVSIVNEAFTFLSLVKLFSMLFLGAFGGIIGVNKRRK